MNILREWRNWQTRTLEGRVEQSLEVQVLSRAHLRMNFSIYFG